MHSHNTLPQSGRPPIEVTAALKEVFDPISFAVADGITAEITAGNTGRLMEAAVPDIQVSFPVDPAYTLLEWDIYEPLNLSQLERLQLMGGDKRDMDKLRVSYLQKHPHTILEDDRGRPTHKGDMLQEYAATCLVGNSWPSEPEVPPLDVHAWKTYEAAVAALNPTQQAQLSHMQDVRRSNSWNWHWQSPKLQTVNALHYVHNPHSAENAVTSNIVLPVSAYGEAFTRSLADSTVAMQTYADQHTADLAAVLIVGKEDVLQEYTARAAEAHTADSSTTLETLKEGILTNAQAIAVLTAEKVPGYDDPYALAADIVQSGLVERLARYSPMGLVGPMALNGYYFPGCIVRAESGGLAFSDEFEGYLKAKRNEYVAEFVIAQADIEPADGQSRPIGRICPAAGKDGGIQALAEAQVALSSQLANR